MSAADETPPALDIQSRTLWPTHFYVARYPGAAALKPRLVELCYRLREEGASWGIAKRAKHNLYESRADFLAQPEAQALVEFFGTVIANVFEKDVEFPESWCHVTNGGGFHDTHAHPDFARAGICGIYYLQCGECTSDPPNGVNRFYSPNVWDDKDVVEIAPSEGMLLLFPGYVRHSALPYSGREDRIVISFNARLRAPESG